MRQLIGRNGSYKERVGNGRDGGGGRLKSADLSEPTS